MQIRMNIELKTMKCDECGSNDSVFDERMGEHVCNVCGLVIVTEMFEETVRLVDDGKVIKEADKGYLGSFITGDNSYKFTRWGKGSVYSESIQKALISCNMVLAGVAPQMNLKDRVEELYLKFLNKGIFGSTSHEARATAVVYYALLENGTQHTIKEVSEEFPDASKSAKKLIRKIKQVVGVQNLPYNPRYRLDRTCLQISDCIHFKAEAEKTLEYFEAIIVNSDYTKSPSYYASICWITSSKMLHPTIQRQTISSKTGFSEWVIYRETKKLLNLICLEKVSELRGKMLW